MAPGNGRHPSHTGTIPKTKVRNNCNVPQEAVTPTRRDMSTNLVSTSLDWVPVSEYNPRSNYSQSRKPSNNTNHSDHELTDIDNSVAFEGGFGRFVPVRPQPRVLPLNAQNRDNISDHQDDAAGSSMSNTLHPYAHQMQNGLTPHSNHAAAAVMIVNPTTPNAVAGNISQSFNAPNQNRNNLTRNLNPARNTFEGSHASNNNTPPVSNSRAKTVNLINNMYEGQSFSNLNENNHVDRESARVLGEAIVAACPDAAAVERRLGQIREYIRVTSSLVDTMRNSEDEAFIEHTKDEYDELVKMVMQLRHSEDNLERQLIERKPDNIEVPAEETEVPVVSNVVDITEIHEEPTNNNDAGQINNNLKKVNNIENEQINKLHSDHTASDAVTNDAVANDEEVPQTLELTEESVEEVIKDNEQLNQMLRQNIQSCVEKVAQIEQLKKTRDALKIAEIEQLKKARDALKMAEIECVNKANEHKVDVIEQQDVTRPVSVQSNGSAYSDNELWQNEIKNKMEMSQMRLTALKQQQKRLIKYQEEAKQQLDEMNRDRQAQETQPATHDNFTEMQSHPSHSGNYSASRMYAANQIGVATTLPHSTETCRQQDMDDQHDQHSSHHSQDGRFSHREGNIAGGEEGVVCAVSEGEDDVELATRGHLLQMKLRELQLKKQHMESLVTEFQKLQMATRGESARNTYSSSNEDSADEEHVTKCNKAVGGTIKNEDPFKLMEIKAIKTALQKTKDLMRSVENYETDLPGGQDDAFREMSSNHSNINDNKSDGGGSMGGWSNDGSVCRVRNSLPQRHKFTNEQLPQQLQQHTHQLPQHTHQLPHHSLQPQHSQQLQHPLQQQLSQQPHHSQQMPQHSQQVPHHSQQLPQQLQQQNHDANMASLQEMAQELRMETEKIMGERARMKDMISIKEVSRKQKKVNEEVRPAQNGGGAAPRRQTELRAILAEKQRELEALLNKEKILCTTREQETQKTNPESQTTSVINQSYNSEQEEPDSRSEHLLLDAQNSREIEGFRASGDNAIGGRPMAALPAHLDNYGSDSDSGSRNKYNQRNRPRRRQTVERQTDDSCVAQSNNASQMRHEPRADASNVNMVPPVAQNAESSSNMPYPHMQPPPWNNKSNQDMRTNQFTQNSHSQTMERLMGTPQVAYPPTMPFNMMMPYGMVGQVPSGCACAGWGAWCWHQLLLQQREMHQLREQLNHLEERWRVDTASHTLNNQVPPGNRANNYWDNFRSYSRQNLLSANNKANAEGHPHPPPPPHPLAARSHNPLHRTASVSSPCVTPKRNTDGNEDQPNRRRNLAYERSLSFSSAPDVLNLNQNEEPTPSHSRNEDPPNLPNVNLNRQDPNAFNLNITNPIPEIIQAHSNLTASKKKPKLAKNRRNCSLEYSQTSNINIASASEVPNPNLASTSQDKATSKLFDLLKENVYSEVTALIGVNESHPDFLIQLFRELQLISSDSLRQKVLQSIRNILSQYSSLLETQESYENRPEPVPSTSDHYSANAGAMQIDHKIVRFLLLKSDEYCTAEFLDALASHILSGTDARYLPQAKRRLLELFAKYEGMRVCQITSDVIENLPLFISESETELPESSMLQDVAGSLNLFSSSESQLHNLNAYDMYDNADINDNSTRSSQDGKVDLINCAEMHNGDLAEADQTCPSTNGPPEGSQDEAGALPEALPDVVDTDEVTPTEAEAEWLGLDRVPTRLHMDESSERQKD